MSELSRLMGVLFEPTKAFTDIAARPTFWVPLVLTTLALVTYTVLLVQHLGFAEITRQANIMNPRAAQQMAQLTDAQREQAQKFTGFATYGGAVLGPTVRILFVGLVLLGMTAIFSAGIRYAQLLAILAYSSIPGIIQTALTIVVLFLKKPEDFFMLNPLVFNPGAFMDFQTSSKFWYTMASLFDLFTIWGLLLSAVGIKAAAGKKMSFGSAVFVVFAPWLLFSLIRAGLAGLFS